METFTGIFVIIGARVSLYARKAAEGRPHHRTIYGALGGDRTHNDLEVSQLPKLVRLPVPAQGLNCDSAQQWAEASYINTLLFPSCCPVAV